MKHTVPDVTPPALVVPSLLTAKQLTCILRLMAEAAERRQPCPIEIAAAQPA